MTKNKLKNRFFFLRRKKNLTLRPPPTIFPTARESLPRIYKSPILTDCDARLLVSEKISEPRSLYECIFTCHKTAFHVKDDHTEGQVVRYKKDCLRQCYVSFGVDSVQKADNFSDKCARFFDLGEYLEGKLGERIVK